MSPLTTEVMVLRELELAPVVLHPQQISRATEIRLLLARIEFIAIHEVIVREEGVIYFVLGIYRYRQQKGLPSTRNSRRKLSASQPIASKKLSDREPTDRAPDYQIEQRYSSFARLRSNVAHIARKHHPKCKTCAYCSGLLDFLHMTPCKPSLKVKFATTTEERKHILSAFINDLVYMVREGYASCPRHTNLTHLYCHWLEPCVTSARVYDAAALQDLPPKRPMTVPLSSPAENDGTGASSSRKRSTPRSSNYGTSVFCESKREDEEQSPEEDDAKDNDFFLRRGARQLQTQTLRLRRNVACTFVVAIGIVVLFLVSYVHQSRQQNLRTDVGESPEQSTRQRALFKVLQQLTPLQELEKRVSVNGELNTTITVAEKLVDSGPIAFYTRAYEDSVPGPLLVLKPGDVLNIHLVNNLGPNVLGEWSPNTMHEPNNTNLHFHGMHVDPTGTEDNVFRIVAPGESADTHLHVPLNHPRGLFHYHPHFHGSVFLQMGGGMVGPIVVEDDPKTVPSEYAAIKQKHVLVVQEFKFTGGMMSSLVEAAKASHNTLDMQLTYTSKSILEAQVRELYPDVHEKERPIRNAKLSKELLEEMDSSEDKPEIPPIGQYFSVNGQYLPKIEVRPHENVLLRMLHAGGTAMLELQVPGCSILLAASDGLSLPKPRPLDTVILLSGARVDLILNCEPSADGGPEILRPLQSVKDPKIGDAIGSHSDLYSGVLAFIHVQGESLNEAPITAVPAPSDLYGPSKGLLDLSEKDRAGMDPLPFLFEFSMGEAEMKDGFYYKPYYINRKLFDGTSIRTMKLGRVQEWVVINEKDESGAVTYKNHPFHLHTNAFQIVDMSHGHGVDYEVGDWRDVISVPTPGNVTIRFRPEDFTGIVAAHCHILGHSDAGMIAGVDMISGD
ncbi:hypothetical protein G195_008089 [Phytophthora kernoviae 00238/432]|uniref:Plastocyanin-like domain-containing protein n=1 Tax=Phytophthora kernoviae 00238/432 TaxID=1284355 RepID=A0A8J4S106_9STRA|nr:hypothetical protein G195_008089 [Phytophthora kernoviae 00238/432]